ncbi:nuclear GTPase SLIP-GC-like isoform X6 [Haliotis cracherodii]|uniref:nuclear GTPase SLIP-GC-like isoform X6 n=1 Tax=Haliotis cracherodii TaxID=6455 RepID=UPI0039EB27FE
MDARRNTTERVALHMDARRIIAVITTTINCQCEGILNLLGNATPEDKREGACTIVQKARKDLERIKQYGDPPEITVAVYGETGSGKSSLLNALLDQPSLLPTSGMGRACTSVVMKIEENKTSSDFEADIEFLTKEEWKKEFDVLKHDLGQNDGDDDEDTDVYEEARAKFAEVYGDFEPANLDTLLDDDTDTAEMFGTVKELRKISYMETCDVLLIVTKIQRAVDNKTVKNALGDKLFRQLLMDQTKAVLACTQTDDVNLRDVIRKLKLPQKEEWTELGRRYKKQEQDLQQQLEDLKRSKQEDPGNETMESSLYQQLERLRTKQGQFKREKTSTCAVQRNEFVRNTIQNKSSSQLDYPRDLKVFCVSSSDYIKLGNLLTCDDDDDDKPPVFQSTEETEIPGLRTYLQGIVFEMQKKHRMSLQNDFQGIIAGVLMYLMNSKRGRKDREEELIRHLETLRVEEKSIIKELDSYLQSSCLAPLDATLKDATQEGIRQAKPTVELWARPVNKRRREHGGLHSNTYKATVRRMGTFISTGIRYIIDMNHDLADPFVQILSQTWTRLFGESEWVQTVESQIKEPASIAITRCIDAIMKFLGDSDSTLLKDLTRLKTDTLAKLTRLDSLWEKTIERQQREITHGITYFIKEQMKSTYEQCMQEEGLGAFNRMKLTMAGRTERMKSAMFHQLQKKITESLDQLKDGFIREATQILEDVFEDTEKQIMPLWQTLDGTNVLETLIKCEGLIQTLSEEFAEYKDGLHELDGQQRSSSLKRQHDDIPPSPMPEAKLVRLEK